MSLNRLIAGVARGEQVDPIQPIQPIGPTQGADLLRLAEQNAERLATPPPEPTAAPASDHPAADEIHSIQAEPTGTPEHVVQPEHVVHQSEAPAQHDAIDLQPGEQPLTPEEAAQRAAELEQHHVAPEEYAKYGVEQHLVEHMQRMLDDQGPGAYVEVKPGSEDALARREDGAVGKPEQAKPKSIRELDQYIGYGNGAQDKGLVGFGPPQEPSKPADMSQQEWDALKPQADKAYAQRLNEYNNKIGDFAHYAQDGYNVWMNGQQVHVYPRISTSENPVQWTTAQGEQRTLGPNVVYLVDGNNKFVAPLAGDVDGFSAYSPQWGTPGTAEYAKNEQQFWSTLARDSGGAVQHDGNTAAWNPQDPGLQRLRTEILWQYAANNPNGAPVMRITAGGVTQAAGPALRVDGGKVTGDLISGPVRQGPPAGH